MISPINSDVEALAGKTIALVGLPADQTAALVHALEQAHAVACVLKEGDSIPVPSKGRLFDVVAIDASLDWDAEGTDMALKISGGVQPLTLLVNGVPRPAQAGQRTLFFTPDGPGFARLTVMDARGVADSVVVRIE